MAVSAVAILSLALGASPARAAHLAAESSFPSGYEGYHTYDQMVADIDAVVAAHPNIAEKIALSDYLPAAGYTDVSGKSFEGREIWVVKISSDVSVDQDEPEVLFESLHHAREHLATEMSLYLIHLLTDNYRANPANIHTELEQRVTDIVNSREIWIVPMVNPDGAEFDIRNGRFHSWRKNRQTDLPGGAVGIDLNRNWGYQWGCCGGSSGNPSSSLYRGPSPWAAPEVAALRDFVLSRRIGGRQQISAAISWHTYGQLVMWPYGYTYKNVPRTMTADDHAAFVAQARQMASLNGYRAEQLSDMYILDGDASDWLYGDQRIFAYTIEMYPPDPSNLGDFYPPDDGSPGGVIDTQTTRNTDAALYFLEQAGCPYAAAGLAVTDCGPLYDDFEADRGWGINEFGVDTATTGVWERARPAKTSDAAGVKQLKHAASGLAELVTGAAAGASPTDDSVNGLTTASSPAITLGDPGSSGWRLSYRFSFAHDASSTRADYLRLSAYDTDSGTAVTLWQLRGNGRNRNASWKGKTINLDALAGRTVELVVQANDGADPSLVEAALDDVRVYRLP